MSLANPFVIFTLVIINTALSFFALTFLIEGLLKLIQKGHYRTRAYLRLLPVIKLPVDFLLFAFFEKDILINLNAWGCKYYLTWFLTQFPNEALLKGMLLGAVLIGFLITSYKVILYVRSYLAIDELCRKSSSCHRKASFSTEGFRVLQTDKVISPCAFGRNTVLIPSKIVRKLTQDEFDAIMAHEIEHLKTHDPTLKLVCYLLSALFWWIPTGWWLKKIEEEQESACDTAIFKYGIDQSSICSALLKALHNRKALCAAMGFLSTKASYKQRIERILNHSQGQRKPIVSHLFLLFTLLLTQVSVWIC